HGRVLRLRLVEGRERSTAAEPEQHDLLEAEFVGHPPHSGTEVEGRPLHDECRFVGRVAGVESHCGDTCFGEGAKQEVAQEVRSRVAHDHADVLRVPGLRDEVAVQRRIVAAEPGVHLDATVVRRFVRDALEVVSGRGGTGGSHVTVRYLSIMSWSSWSRMWQCHTYPCRSPPAVPTVPAAPAVPTVPA